MSNKYKEIEYKYDASQIKLKDFQELMNKLNPRLLLEVGSWDFYYTNDQDEFIRYRKSDVRPELTIKRKTHKSHNQNRIEVNVGLAETASDEDVEAFVKLLKYDHNFKIYKSCFIYYFDEVDVVFYIVYDENMDEKGRFVEIEYLEEKAHDKKTEHIFKQINKYEKSLKGLGIDKNKRISKSLFEMFKK